MKKVTAQDWPFLKSVVTHNSMKTAKQVTTLSESTLRRVKNSKSYKGFKNNLQEEISHRTKKNPIKITRFSIGVTPYEVFADDTFVPPPVKVKVQSSKKRWSVLLFWKR